MSNPFVAEIRIVGFNFAPKGWAICDGQLLPISQNTALFSLLGTTYGGDGKSTFGLPNLQGRTPMQPGQGPGLSLHDLGETGGEESLTLLESEMPSHTHAAQCSSAAAGLADPSGNVWAPAGGRGRPGDYSTSVPDVTLNASALALAGQSLPHNNRSPYLVLNFVIALQGVFPARS